MNNTPPFDLPYITIAKTIDAEPEVETLADGSDSATSSPSSTILQTINTPPFDPPYRTITHTTDGEQVVETLVNRTERIVVSERAISNLSGTSSLNVVNPIGHGNGKVQMYLDVPYADKEDAKPLGAKWDKSMLKWYVPHGVDIHLFKRWWPKELKQQTKSFDKL